MPTTEELAQQVAALTARVEVNESTLAIHALKARYAELVDQRFTKGTLVDPASLRRIAGEIGDLFAPEGTWDGGPGLGVAAGRSAIVDRLENPTLTFSRHLFVNPLIRVDGDHATGRWDLLCPCQRADGQAFWMSGTETDRYIRMNGTWLHASMALTTHVMAPISDGWGRIFS